MQIRVCIHISVLFSCVCYPGRVGFALIRQFFNPRRGGRNTLGDTSCVFLTITLPCHLFRRLLVVVASSVCWCVVIIKARIDAIIDVNIQYFILYTRPHNLLYRNTFSPHKLTTLGRARALARKADFRHVYFIAFSWRALPTTTSCAGLFVFYDSFMQFIEAQLSIGFKYLNFSIVA